MTAEAGQIIMWLTDVALSCTILWLVTDKQFS